MIFVERIAAFDFGDEAGVASFDFNVGARMLVGIEENAFGLAHDALENALKIREPFHARDAAELLGFVFGELVAFPGFEFGFGFAQKKNFAMLLVIGVRINEENRFLLLDA